MPPPAPEMIARSYLFVPGDRPDRFDKACAAGADRVIVDLEDAVPPAGKYDARTAIRTWLRPDKQIVLRINADTTEWFRDDLVLAREPGVAGIILPKAEAVDGELRALCTDEGKFLLPLIETARGFANAGVLASVPGVQRLLFGTLDFQMDLGIDGEGDELAYYRSEMVLVSRLAGIQPPVDGPCTSWEDQEMLMADSQRARKLDSAANYASIRDKSPSSTPRSRPAKTNCMGAQSARGGASSGGAAAAVDGRMIDRPVILMAEQIVREAARREIGVAL